MSLWNHLGSNLSLRPKKVGKDWWKQVIKFPPLQSDPDLEAPCEWAPEKSTYLLECTKTTQKHNMT